MVFEWRKKTKKWMELKQDENKEPFVSGKTRVQKIEKECQIFLTFSESSKNNSRENVVLWHW